MTVQMQNATQYFEGPITVGSTLSIVNFTFINNTHVSVKVRGEDTIWAYGEDYTIEGANTEQRIVHILKPVAEGQILAVYLDVPITQNVEPEEGGDFPASTQEFVLDKLTYICQMLYERITRSLQVSVDTVFDGVLYSVEENAGKAIIVNSTGTGVGYSAFNINDLENIVKRIYQSIPEIGAVGDNIESVIIDAENIESIKTTATSIGNVNNVGGSIDKVNNVSDNLATIAINADNIEDINTTANSITGVNTVATSITNVNIVGNDLALGANSNIKKVVDNKTNIDTVANNIIDVQNAEENAQIAKTSAAEAKQWAIGDPTQPPGYSAKYWAEKGKADVIEEKTTAITEITNTKNTAIDNIRLEKVDAISAISTNRTQAVNAVNSAKNVAIKATGANVVAANAAAERAQESAMKAIGWNITYTDEDILDFTDLTPEEIEENLSYIGEARVAAIADVNNTKSSAITEVNNAKDTAIAAVNQAAQADFDLMDEYVQHVNNAMVQTQAAETRAKLSETEAKRAELTAQNSENSASNLANQAATSADNAAAQVTLCETAKQGAETAAINANASATNAANTLTQVRSITETATQVTGNNVIAANEAANRAQDFAMKSLGWDIKYEDEDSLDFSSNAASFETKLKALPGYSETGIQVLKSVNGALQWVTE